MQGAAKAKNWKVGWRIQDRWEIHRIPRGGMGIAYIVCDHESQRERGRT